LPRFLVLLGLTGVAVSQPLLSSLGEQPTVFVFHRVSGFELVVFAVVVAFVPPVLMWALGSIVGRFWPLAGRVLHVGFVAALVAMAASQLLRLTFGIDQTAVVAVLALAAGGAAAWAFVRFDQVRRFTAYLAPLPAVAVALFLWASETTPLLSLGSKGAAATSATGVSPVVVLIVDELPTKSVLGADRELDRERFPNLARFAEDATWYRNYTTTATHTEFAVPSMLTAQPPRDEEPLFTSYPDNLFSLLEPTHELSVYESFTKLCPRADCEGTGRRKPAWRALAVTTFDLFRARVDPFASTEVSTMADFAEETVGQPVVPAREGAAAGWEGALSARQDATTKGYPERFRRFLRSMQPTSAPTLHLMHLVLPHQPWRYYPGGGFASTLESLPSPEWGYPFSSVNDQGEWVATLSEQRHLLQAQYTDALIGQMLDRLHRIGRYDESAIVIVSDHGYSFELETPVRDVEEATLDSLAYTPLLVKLPGQTRGGIDDANVTALDVLPTIADAAGVAIPFEVAGLPAHDEQVARRDGAKTIADIRPPRDGFRGEIDFTMKDTAPRASDRWIPSRSGRTDDLWALHDAAGVEDLIGRQLDDLVTATSGTATVQQLAAHERGGDQPGIVTGTVEGVPGQGTVLVAMNGVVVGGSPLFTLADAPRTFAALTPEEFLGRSKTIRLAVRTSEGVVELTVG
jgi:hypothetical protein